MGFDRRGVTVTIPNPAATTITTLNCRSTWIRPLAFNIKATTDGGVKLRLTDALGRIFYLDSGDVDYQAAKVYTPLLLDDVTTGLTTLVFDSTGVAGAAAQHGPMPVVKSPIEVAIINDTTVGDTVTVNLEYEYGCFNGVAFTMPTAAATVSTLAVSLGARYARLLGFRIHSVGTSVTQILKMTDADGKVIFLDAGARNYDAAYQDNTLILDATVTNLTQVVPRDATGAAIQAGVGRFETPLIRSPLTIDLSDSEGNDEVVSGYLFVKTG